MLVLIWQNITSLPKYRYSLINTIFFFFFLVWHLLREGMLKWFFWDSWSILKKAWVVAWCKSVPIEARCCQEKQCHYKASGASGASTQTRSVQLRILQKFTAMSWNMESLFQDVSCLIVVWDLFFQVRILFHCELNQVITCKYILKTFTNQCNIYLYLCAHVWYWIAKYSFYYCYTTSQNQNLSEFNFETYGTQMLWISRPCMKTSIQGWNKSKVLSRSFPVSS